MLRGLLHFVTWFFSHVFDILHAPMRLYYRLRTPKRCPPVYEAVYFQPATVIADQIRSQQVTSAYVVSMYIKRAKEVNVCLNAIVQDRFELAMLEAQRADDFVQRSGLNEKELAERYPLLGVPVTVKEAIAVEGMSHAVGSKMMRQRKAVCDASVVEMLRTAGAIVYLVSATPELCMNWETFNYVNGRTLNPYDTRRTCGGSSGGEAALVATCGSLIGIGSDLVGSARGPPSFCGVYGYRTSGNLTPTNLHHPSLGHPALTICPITRYAIDLPLLLRCMVARDRALEIKLFEEFEPRRIRVFYMFGSGSNYPTSSVNAHIVGAMKKVVAHLANDGFFTQSVDLKLFADQFDIAFLNLLSIDGLHEAMSYSDASVPLELLRTLLGCGRVIPTIPLFEVMYGIFKRMDTEQRVERCRRLARELKGGLEEVLGDDGVLLYPTTPNVAHIHGRIYGRTQDTCYMGIFSVLDMPALAIPIGQDPKGMPIGIQVVAKQLNDRLPMIFARHMEVHYGGWAPPPYSTSRE